MRILACCTCLGLLAALGASFESSHAQDTPWKRRMRTGVVLDDPSARAPTAGPGTLTAQELRRLGLRPRGAGLVDLSHWPDEPPSPADVSPQELAQAMRQLCPASVGTRDLERYALAIVRYGREFSVDPWLLAALVYTQGYCSEEIDNGYGTGLTLINVGMHERHVRNGVYHFAVRTERGWEREELDVGEFPFRRAALGNPEPNLYFAAALLSVFGRQCPDIDRAFHSAPHRHPVSHFVWGDRVGDTGPEDRILTARRRLLNSHAQTNRPGGNRLGDLALVSPLDGYPRIVTSGLGEPRDHGRRPHRGIDFASEYGEPVRSVAAGRVTFAGVDWERKAHIPLEPWGATIVHERHMGPRGLFVEVDHGNGVVSLYAHLATYEVKIGEHVEAGQRLGEVGRTGVRDSGPHLHFGLFRHGEVLDPLDHLAPYLFPPELTKRGHAELAKRYSGRAREAASARTSRSARVKRGRVSLR
ncbi:MAG TPA: M23 family metallopeptidase [Polyangiales bacterium]|nr:M23 family metallopeptidase [Polyangiales bacterium]